MKYFLTLVMMTGCMLLIQAGSHKADGEPGKLISADFSAPDSVLPVSKIIRTSYNGTDHTNSLEKIKVLFSVDAISKNRVAVKASIGFSKQGRSINAYYFPGTSNHRALVIGGVHGSELSSIEVATNLVKALQKGEQPYYTVIIIPSLFPDNAAAASNYPSQIGSCSNLGRYSHAIAVDPNRQMPALGKSFEAEEPHDQLGREIETENQLLLAVINAFRPQRIVNIHAIREVEKGGIYADPRTDSKGYALGYESDSSLAIDMSVFIRSNGGYIAGNQLDSNPTTRYHNDPPIVPAGYLQPRNLKGSGLSGGRGQGVSLGSWASTAVNDPTHEEDSRPAIRIITMEFPGYKRSQDYAATNDQENCQKNIKIYANAINRIFLAANYVENIF